jgi:branched-chain amino acid transport system ATP-binding protein
VRPTSLPAPVIDITGLSKDYHGLRPLRIDRLTMAPGEQTAVLGLDQPMGETFINLVTGAALPEQGVVAIFGRPTSAIADSSDWLGVVDRFGIVSERAVLLNAMTVMQNLSIPFTLDIDPPPEDIRARAASLAAESGIPEAEWSRAVGEADAVGRFRIRLARALALDPAVLLLEHASADLPRDAVTAAGALVRTIASNRGCAVLAVGADAEFASAAATRVLQLDPATGRLSEVSERGRWSFFRRGR